MDNNLIILIAVVAAVIILTVLLTIGTFSNRHFMEVYNRIIKINTKSPYDVSMFINHLNDKYLSNKVEVVPINRVGGDFYNAKKRFVAVNLNNQTSLATFAIIAHEMGHAYQDIVEKKLKKFNRLRVAGAIIGKMFLPILIAGIVLLFFVKDYLLVIGGTLGLMVLIVLLAIIIKTRTIKIEKAASEKGIDFLSDFLSNEEIKECKKLLNAARLTYWADLIKLLLGWSGLTNTTEMFK
jgi:Zn-dependent membrane protease YugP